LLSANKGGRAKSILLIENFSVDVDAKSGDFFLSNRSGTKKWMTQSKRIPELKTGLCLSDAIQMTRMQGCQIFLVAAYQNRKKYTK
jgi:hypothetical protein